MDIGRCRINVMTSVLLKIKRQDDPGDLPYWEDFEIEAREGLTVAAALASIGENPVNANGNPTVPVVFESSCLNGMCGACSMVINGKIRLACKTLVNELDEPVKIEPMGKFSVLRDLKVDRGKMFDAIARFSPSFDCAPPHDNDPPLRISPERQRRLSVFSTCVMCGACAEACPQVNPRTDFSGAFIFARTVTLNEHPISSFNNDERLSVLKERGGIADCAGAKVCESVCPMGIPLSEGISALQKSATAHSVRKLTR